MPVSVSDLHNLLILLRRLEYLEAERSQDRRPINSRFARRPSSRSNILLPKVRFEQCFDMKVLGTWQRGPWVW